MNHFEIGIAHDQCNYVECVIVSKLSRLLGSARGVETLDRFEVEEVQARVRLSCGVTERPYDSGDLRNLNTQSGCTELLHIFRSPSVYLRQERAHCAKPLSARYACILPAFDLAKVVVDCHRNSIAKREMQNFFACGPAGDTAKVN